MSHWYPVLIQVFALLVFLVVWYRDWRRDYNSRHPPEKQDWYWEALHRKEAEQRKADAFTQALIRDSEERRSKGLV